MIGWTTLQFSLLLCSYLIPLTCAHKSSSMVERRVGVERRDDYDEMHPSASTFSELVFGNRVLRRPSHISTAHSQPNTKSRRSKSIFSNPDPSSPLKSPSLSSTIHQSPISQPNQPESLNIDQPGSAYGLIHKLFPVEANEIAVTNLDEIPEDLNPEEVWLSDGNLLVLRGGLGMDEGVRISSHEGKSSPTIRQRLLSHPKRRRRYSLRQRGFDNYDVI